MEIPVDTVQILVQAGAVGISIGLMILLYLFGRIVFAVIKDHMHKTDQTILQNAQAMTNLTAVIKENTKAINRNTEVAMRVERVLDRS